MNEVIEESALLTVNDLDQFVGVLTAWHTHQVATVEHLSAIPDGVEVTEGDGTPFKLEGDVLRAFRLGIAMSLNYLGTLPFVVEHEEPVPAV